MKSPTIALKVALVSGRGADRVLNLRSHQGIYRDQRRLSLVSKRLLS